MWNYILEARVVLFGWCKIEHKSLVHQIGARARSSAQDSSDLFTGCLNDTSSVPEKIQLSFFDV